LEDKLVQLAVSTILSEIYEPLFLSCSYGFRPDKNCHDALRALSTAVFPNMNGAIVEIDIRKYFNTIPHKELMNLLRNKISDQRFLRLIEVLIKTPIKEGKRVVENTCGCPQGSIISPVLANIYLHHVIDEWFESIKDSHIHGRAKLIRYADDMVFTFENKVDARRFYRVLPKRLAKFGLELHADKSQVLPAGLGCAQQAHQQGKRIPTFNFLGFTCYWGLSNSGKFWRLKVKSRGDRKRAKLVGLRKFLQENRNTPNTPLLIERVKSAVRGWINYHAVSDNRRQVSSFIYESKRIIFSWFNRRGDECRLKR
jgi:group II intron reverse transcriptase/maturase